MCAQEQGDRDSSFPTTSIGPMYRLIVDCTQQGGKKREEEEES